MIHGASWCFTMTHCASSLLAYCMPPPYGMPPPRCRLPGAQDRLLRHPTWACIEAIIGPSRGWVRCQGCDAEGAMPRVRCRGCDAKGAMPAEGAMPRVSCPPSPAWLLSLSCPHSCSPATSSVTVVASSLPPVCIIALYRYVHSLSLWLHGNRPGVAPCE